MKNKIFTLAIVGLLSLAMAIPTLAASSSYSFTMNYRMVDGAANGQFHSLSAGTAKISGSHYQYASEPNPTGPNVINYQLWNKTSGNNFGIVKSTPTSDGNRVYFQGSYPTSVGGGTNYYLQIWRVDDGRDIKGSGSVYN